MIATGGVITGLAALKRQDSSRSQHHLPTQSPVPPPKKKRSKKKPRTDIVVVRGRIRLYSASGFFLVLGVLILMVGIAMAVLGYWPHKDHQRTAESKQSGNDTRMNPDQAGKVAHFFEQHLHSEKMKMLGPFTMGIGIFIFICANAILHENRDRETKVIHMRDMYSTVIDIHSLRIQEQKCMNGAYMGPYGDHEVHSYGQDSHYTSRLAANTLLTFSSLGGDVRLSRRTSSAEDEEGLMNEGGPSLLSPGYRDRSGSFFGFQPESIRRWEDQHSNLKKCQTRSIVSSSISAFTLPVIKLNNCVIDEPDIDNITEESEQLKDRLRPPSMESLTVPVPDISKAFKPPCTLLRSNSATESPAFLSASSQSSLSTGSTSDRFLSPGAARKDFGSNNSLHMLSAHSKSLDLERGPVMLTVQPEQRKHPSWPRLDRSNSKGYTKLENKEDPMDRLLVPPAAVKRDYTKKEKLLMISRSHNNLSFEHDEFMSSTLKRGTSETRF
ncbi:transmembrane protein 200A [Trichomycterus rosablanca]|uniref:transmembrane protein 200A n=1 Tax=Trichomycterus rosablanca TaxID=2290929 RepID=UPI002F3550A3